MRTAISSVGRAASHLSLLVVMSCTNGCPSRLPPTEPDAPPQPPPTEPEASSLATRPHHHVESCWLDADRAYRDQDVDLMLVVIGLNHRSGACIQCPVGSEGVQRLAKAIHEAWPDPSNLVIVGSAFDGRCSSKGDGTTCITTDPPVPAQRVADELTALYGAPFTVNVTESPDSRWPGQIGVIAGSRFRPLATRQLQFTDWLTQVNLRDSVSGFTIPVFAMHTGFDAALSLDDLKRAAETAKTEAQRAAIADDESYTVPIVAGDFNLTEAALVAVGLSGPPAADMLWANKNVACAEAGGLPSDLVFTAQNGNLMHAFTGRWHASETIAQTCAGAEFERIRFSYSVAADGGLAIRAMDEGKIRPAQEEGIILDGIAHNVIAVGLSLRRRTEPWPASCRPATVTTCPSSRPWCDCSGQCDTPARCRACESSTDDTCPDDRPYCACARACLMPSECDRRCR